MFQQNDSSLMINQPYLKIPKKIDRDVLKKTLGKIRYVWKIE